MQTVTIDNKVYSISEVIPASAEMKKANPTIEAMVLLTGKRGAAKIAFQFTNGSIEISSSL